MVLATGFAAVSFEAGSVAPFLGAFALNCAALATSNRRVHAMIALAAAATVSVGIGFPILVAG
jgi:hypothetical protein